MKRNLLRKEEDSDPMSVVSNLFDVAMVFAVALMVALVTRYNMTEMFSQEDFTMVKNPGKENMEIITKEGQKINRYTPSEDQEEQMARRIDERASRFCREQNERASRFLFDESASQPSYGRSSSNLSGGQKSFFIGERPKAEIIRPSVPRNLTKVGLATVSKPSAAGTLPVNVLAGQVIEHERFGIGDVIKVEGIGENSKATVRFRNAGEKQLLLKFARFKVVE